MTDLRKCLRCGFSCTHVEDGGIEFCPNCGPPLEDALHPGEVRYDFSYGCSCCKKPGHAPLKGYMRPRPANDILVRLGLAPAIEARKVNFQPWGRVVPGAA